MIVVAAADIEQEMRNKYSFDQERKIRANKSKKGKIMAIENHESHCLNTCNCKHFMI
jgi:hypothetical protein